MPPSAISRKRILCVDDDEDTRIMMQALLTAYGYEPIVAASLSDALESARSGGLALCILDHWIPDGGGIQLCQQSRTFDTDTPIIFFSAAALKSDIQDGLDAGAQEYLLKPYIEHLKETIDRLIGHSAFNTEH
jgi:DNA-binding response OmpR family regulator